jgi:hypothetical protein
MLEDIEISKDHANAGLLHDSRRVMQLAMLKNASRISGEPVSSAHQRNILACSRNSFGDEFEAIAASRARRPPTELAVV